MDNLYPVIFLGISPQVKSVGMAPPVTPIDIFGLSKQSAHVIYPIPLSSFQWVFLINSALIGKDAVIHIEMRDKENKMVVSFEMEIIDLEPSTNADKNVPIVAKIDSPIGRKKEDAIQPTAVRKIIVSKDIPWLIQTFSINAALKAPGVYDIYYRFDKADIFIDRINFIYQKVASFTGDQIKAFESDPLASKMAVIEIGCKHCPSKLRAYTAFNRVPDKEKQGFIWQHDLQDQFVCSCGKTNETLIYIKESMHGLLGRDKLLFSGELSYESRYSYSETVQIMSGFNYLLEKSTREEDFQTFIHNNPILIAKYHAKKIYFKPDISGKFQADIIVLDTKNQLILIELESPATLLFKKDGHPTSQLNHAYGQIVDWMEEYDRSPEPLLSRLQLKKEDISCVKGAVIAGMRNKEKPEYYSRHMSKPAYPDIEFLTYDGLVESLAQIVRAINQKKGGTM
ncbi:MAG: DUF4263 domain-containing protein [Candidatus Omnitrophica bacterium]|jgi:hypothetical protein|nr:DUF4263 domain-containing protein [Candidatus Omnitrophota bacterium]